MKTNNITTPLKNGVFWSMIGSINLGQSYEWTKTVTGLVFIIKSTLALHRYKERQLCKQSSDKGLEATGDTIHCTLPGGGRRITTRETAICSRCGHQTLDGCCTSNEQHRCRKACKLAQVIERWSRFETLDVCCTSNERYRCRKEGKLAQVLERWSAVRNTEMDVAPVMNAPLQESGQTGSSGRALVRGSKRWMDAAPVMNGTAAGKRANWLQW
ncbi:hypothetical protein EGW08_016974 [Elysia chlorotica]|uniref:Uncharacterized protein n=1 Tax=Elysia chlorotica TaxID=188477 RepID=A0A433T145_ELYCH|nr:hypothetical protein EGW08_016974 [Elysia chlorotica]